MKLVTYASARQSRLGVVQDGFVVDVAAAFAWMAEERITDAKLAAAVQAMRKPGRPPEDMRELLSWGESYRKALGVVATAAGGTGKKTPKGLLVPLRSARLRAPLPHPWKIVCIGLNYADHAREQGLEPPTRPILFLKSHNTICGPGDPIRLPPNSTQVDYEAEFAVIIGKRGRRIPESDAHKYIAGYTILQDVSARDLQYGDRQWFRGKSCDTFAPTGPWIVTADELPDINNLRISLTLNGQTMQDSSTGSLIFKAPFLISYLSRSVTWEPGDLLATGTPGGVGRFRNPQVFLKPGDTVSVSVEGIGTLTNPVVGP
jgi:acylpyruvate hydrolase